MALFVKKRMLDNRITPVGESLSELYKLFNADTEYDNRKFCNVFYCFCCMYFS